MPRFSSSKVATRDTQAEDVIPADDGLYSSARAILRQQYGRIVQRPLMQKDSYILWLTFLTTISMASKDAVQGQESEIKSILGQLEDIWRIEHERTDYRRVKHRSGLAYFIPLLLEVLGDLNECFIDTNLPLPEGLNTMMDAWKNVLGRTDYVKGISTRTSRPLVQSGPRGESSSVEVQS